jgi:opacity protein-like surface antigen
MKTFLLIASLFVFNAAAFSQNFHFNLYAGSSNYNGDLQDKRYTLNESNLAGGFGVSYDITDHISLRSSLLFGTVSGDDKYTRNSIRNLNFRSAITEVSIGAEYYITKLGDHSLTPYVFAGVAVYHFNPYTRDTSGKIVYLRPLSTEGEGFIAGKNYYNLTQIALPFGAGVKLSLSENIQVGLEVGYRKLFTDYLDDVSTTYVDQSTLLANRGSTAVELAYRGDELKNGGNYPPGGTIRGRSGHYDTYYFTMLTLSFRLFPNYNKGEGRNSKLGCPKPVN